MFVSSWEGCLPALPCPRRALPRTLMPDQNYCQFLELPFWFRGVCLMLMWRYWHPDSLHPVPGPTQGQGRGRGRGRGIWCVVVFIVRAMLLFLCFHFWRVNHNDNEGWGWGVAACSRVHVCLAAHFVQIACKTHNNKEPQPPSNVSSLLISRCLSIISAAALQSYGMATYVYHPENALPRTLSHTEARTHSHSQTIAIICNSRCSRAFEKSSKSTLPSTPLRPIPIPIPSHVERLTIYSIPFKSIFSSQFAKRLSTPSDRPRSQTETR